MRSRTLSILATSTLAALLGCPFESLTASPDAAQAAADSTADDSGAVANSERHDDPVDSLDDVSWLQQSELGSGASALRVLMTDAPVDADNVFVRFCGIQVQALGSAPTRTDASPHAADVADARDAEGRRGGSSRGDAGPEWDTAPGQAPADAGAPPVRDTADSDASRGSWQTVSEECQRLDLLTLRDGVTEAVGVATLAPGNYGQIRLLLADASIVVGGMEQPLIIPSGSESGLKIGGGFTLHDGAVTTITLDFDAGRSIRYAPGIGFMMSPIIELVDVTTHGSGGADAGAPVHREAKPSDEARGGAGRSTGAKAPEADEARRAEAAPFRTEPRPAGARRGEPPPPVPEAPPAGDAPPEDDAAEQ